MGCGCGRARSGPSRSDRIKKQTAKITKARKKALLASRAKPVISSASPLTSKSSACLSCIESRQSSEERKRGIRVCHKSNRLINNIIKDSRYTCPLGKWKNTK